MKALLALEDGRTFECRSFTGPGETFGEVVFNTSMSGYQEVLTDPSYRGQMVVMTYPLIGNYGTNPGDVESAQIHVSAFIMKEYQEFPSNFRSSQPLREYLRAQNVLGIDSLDTRALTRHIRTAGCHAGNDFNTGSGSRIAGGPGPADPKNGRPGPCQCRNNRPSVFLGKQPTAVC